MTHEWVSFAVAICGFGVIVSESRCATVIVRLDSTGGLLTVHELEGNVTAVAERERKRDPEQCQGLHQAGRG